jgi:hypothetical protein
LQRPTSQPSARRNKQSQQQQQQQRQQQVQLRPQPPLVLLPRLEPVRQVMRPLASRLLSAPVPMPEGLSLHLRLRLSLRMGLCQLPLLSPLLLQLTVQPGMRLSLLLPRALLLTPAPPRPLLLLLLLRAVAAVVVLSLNAPRLPRRRTWAGQLARSPKPSPRALLTIPRFV